MQKSVSENIVYDDDGGFSSGSISSDMGILLSLKTSKMAWIQLQFVNATKDDTTHYRPRSGRNR